MMKKIIFSVSIIFLILNANAQPAEHAEENKTDTTSLFDKIEKWYSDNMNYGSITILMAAESSILPVPSELVIPPAAYIASKPDSELNIFLVILFGTIGALIGSTLNYYLLGMLVGRTLLYKFADSKIGHLLFLSVEKLQKAEDYFNIHGKTSTFVGRLIPVVRHLISIPAGFAKMNFVAFAIYTFIGAGLWNCCLALLGYIAHGQSDSIKKYSHELSAAIIILFILAVIYFVIRYFYKKRCQTISQIDE